MSNVIPDFPAIVIFGAVRSEGIYESTSFNTAKCLSKYTKVYYVENPYTFRDVWRDRKTAHFKKRKGFFAGEKTIVKDDNLQVVVVPPVLSIHFLPEGKLYRYLLARNERIIANRINGILKRDAIGNYIFMNSFNFHYPNVSKLLKPILTVYQCVDPLILDYDRKHGLVSEDVLLRNADLVLCTSKALYREKLGKNKSTFFIPNAADISHSSKAMDSKLPVSPKLLPFKRPIIGYIGSIERRFDFSLVKEVVQQNRDYDFVFAGPIAYELVPDWLFKQPNLHLIGRVDYDELPHLLKGFRVCLIPFKKDEVSATIFPLKLFEYLGAGKPVISTNFNPDLREFTDDTVLYVDGSNAFSAAIANALRDDSEINLSKRIQIAEKNTWSARAQSIIDLFKRFLLTKKGR